MKNKIFKLTCLLLVVTQMVFAQKIVRGNISDLNGPLPGATVIEQGTTNGVSADFDGNYEISVTDETSVIVISYTGFIAQSVNVGNQSSIDVMLEEDTQMLNEVAVKQLTII